MLSKLFFYRNTNKNSDINLAISQKNIAKLTSSLISELESEYTSVKISPCKPGGTLGIFFYAYLDGKEYFIKTHYAGSEFYKNLKKEIRIYEILYSNKLTIKKVEFDIDNEPFVFLIMTKLDNLKEIIKANDMRNFANEYTQRLNSFVHDKVLTENMYTFKQLLDECEYGLNILSDNNMINNCIFDECKRCLINTKQANHMESISICHGDLSNKNIMQIDNVPIIIDWEDSFVGPSDYDFIYWLTFFEQRKYYKPNMFSGYEVNCKNPIDYMIIITIIKCYMSFISGAYITNSITFNERLAEIFDCK